MLLNQYSNNRAKNTPSFCGLKTIPVKNYEAIDTIFACQISDIAKRLKKNLPDGFLKTQNGQTNIIEQDSLKGFLDSIKAPFYDLPIYLYEKGAKLFGADASSSKIIKNFHNKKLIKEQESILRGIYENGEKFIKEVIKEAEEKGIKLVADPKDKSFPELCQKVTDKYYDLFNKGLLKSKYNTQDERALARVASGTVAAFALYIDFYNKSVRDGSDHTKADKEARVKLRQELASTAGEAELQYVTIGGFQKYVNNSQYGAPIINTIIALGLHVASRVYAGMPLTRVNVLEEKNLAKSGVNYFDLFNKPGQKSSDTLNKQNQSGVKKEEKHILTLKNIGIACLMSVVGGFALRGRKNGTEELNGLKKKAVDELWVSKKELKTFLSSLLNLGDNKTYNYYNRKLDLILSKTKADDTKLFIGEFEKTIKIPFTNIQLSKKELYKIPLMPFNLVKEIVGYPYKIVEKICEQAGVIKKIKVEEYKLKDDYNLVNIYRDFKKNYDKMGDTQVFDQYLEKMLEDNKMNCLNLETKSGVDNAKIGKLTQILGTVASIYFAMTDDFNRTAKSTGNKTQAERDARERGINKFLRIVSQIAIMDVVNGLFKFTYAQSLLGAFSITTICTVLTDSFSRFISGMPFVRMNKAELEEYNKNKKEGILSPYYGLIDKLAS